MLKAAACMCAPVRMCNSVALETIFKFRRWRGKSEKGKREKREERGEECIRWGFQELHARIITRENTRFKEELSLFAGPRLIFFSNSFDERCWTLLYVGFAYLITR